MNYELLKENCRELQEIADIKIATHKKITLKIKNEVIMNSRTT